MLMESWSYLSEGKGLLFSDEMDLPVDAFVRSRKSIMGWDLKPSCDFDGNGLISDREAVESMGFMDIGFPDVTRKPFHSNLGGGILGGEVDNDSSRRVTSTCMITSNLSFGEEESGSKISSSIMESNSQDSSLIDLKLGRLTDCRDAQNGKFSKERSVVSSVHPSLPAKRARNSPYSQAPLCQVYGCNMDLSSSKDYHKRHKVCEVHSKTAKVIVNGIEQRFCQQCSRFHLLAEFDDGKRSCRKRLAGHNERRRKPQFHTLSGKAHKLMQSYQGTKFLETSATKRAPFLLTDIFPGGVLYPERYEQANRCRYVKFGENSISSSQFDTSITNEHSPQKSFLHVHGIGKQYGPGIPPSETESYTVSGAASTIQELSGVSHSSCALSLLSAQSQDLSSQVGGVPNARPLIKQSRHAHHSVGQNLEKPLGVSPLGKHLPNGFYSSGMKSTEVGQIGSIMVSDSRHAVDFEVQADGFFQESNFLNAKYCLSPENGSTVDLLQLSSHLQRVEQQRNSIELKQENGDLCYFFTT